MAVTGGQLKKLNDFFYLVGGHRFDGRYHPFGHHHTHTQSYTDQIRNFKVINSGNSPVIFDYSEITNQDYFHRIDNNLLPPFSNDQTSTHTRANSSIFEVWLKKINYKHRRANGYHSK